MRKQLKYATTMINREKNSCSIPCNLCRSIHINELCLKDRNGNYLRTVICVKCGLIWSDPRPSEEKIKNFYSKEYRKEYKKILKPKLKHIYRDANEAIKRFCFFKEILRDNYNILDIGSGSGVFVYTMRKLGYNTSGIEPDEGHVLFSKEKLQLPVTTGFIQDVQGREVYDLITLHHVLEHLVDPLRELKKIWLLLKDNGYLVVEVPNAEDIKQSPKNRYHKAHICTFNPKTLETLGLKAGFEIHKKAIAPLNGNISIIFKKLETIPLITGEIAGNCQEITKTLNKHTTFHHFITPVPYLKFLKNVFRAIHEQIAIKNLKDSKDIIDSVLSKETMR